jgi:hypothetical protein
MSDPHRTDTSRALDAAPDSDRDAKIEQLLIVGLDRYFAAEYQQAINVWTRALFLDRSHPRARAYIERACSALAERQRESEELLQSGVAAFERGEGGEARRLLEMAIKRGAPSDEALAVLDRLSRLEQGATASSQGSAVRAERAPVAASVATGSMKSAFRSLPWIAAALLLAGAGVGAARSLHPDWRSLRRGEASLTRAKALEASGHLHDALAVLDGVRLTDPQRPDADRLRADIQRQLITLNSASPPAAGDRPGGDGRLP